VNTYLMKRFAVICIAILGMSLFTSACAYKEVGTALSKDNTDTSEHVELTWYVPIGSQRDLSIIEHEANKIIQAEINATLTLKTMDLGSYEQKMNTIVAAAEPFDLAWTSDWTFDYVTNAGRGAFYDITELLDEYAPQSKEMFQPQMIEDAKVGGKLYAIPNYQLYTKTAGFIIQKRFIDKYNLDVNNLKNLEDIIPFLEILKQNEPDIIPFGFGSNKGFFLPTLYGMDDSNGVLFRSNDKSFELLDMRETPEYRQYLDLAHTFYKKGYIPIDAATIKDFNTLLGKGNVAVYMKNTLKPGGEINEKMKNGNRYDVVFVPLANQVYSGSMPTMTAVSHTSRNPERAIQLIELVNTNKQLFNLLAFGIEDKHYMKLNENTVALIQDSGYSVGVNSFFFGNVTNGYVIEGQPIDVWEKTKEINITAYIPPLSGFKFDQSSVKMELANIKAVEDDYLLALHTGMVDPKQYLPIYIDKLRAAGSKKVLEEQQRQLDAWLKTKGE
jgi:putative aldouronate transport system substrate-binding protein